MTPHSLPLRASHNRNLNSAIVRAVSLLIFIGLLVTSSLWISSASLVKKSSHQPPSAPNAPASTAATSKVSKQSAWPSSLRTRNFGSLLTLQQGQPVTVTTYAGNCTTAKSVFNVQDNDKTVCAKVTGLD